MRRKRKIKSVNTKRFSHIKVTAIQPSGPGTSAQGPGPHQPLNKVQATGNVVGHTGKLELARASIKL